MVTLEKVRKALTACRKRKEETTPLHTPTVHCHELLHEVAPFTHICLMHVQTWQSLNRAAILLGGLVEFYKSMAKRQQRHSNLPFNIFT